VTGPIEPAPERRESLWDWPRIYVASLTDYNAGVLHGEWISAEVGAEVVRQAVDEMLAESPTARDYGEVAEEWAIHDFSGFGNVHLHEHENLERVCRIAEGLVTHGDAFGAWVTDREGDDLPSPEDFEDHFLGEWASEVDWGESLLDDLGIDLDNLQNVPEGLRPYVQVDVEGWVRDMRLGGEISVVESKAGVYVFWT
jgi:antirestriction protein